MTQSSFPDRAHRDWLLSLAFIYLQQNHYKKSLVLLQVAAKLFTKDIYVSRGLAFACLKSGRYRDALMVCDRNLKAQGIKLETAPFLLIRCQALWALERRDEAKKSLDKYYKLTGSPSA